MMEHYHDKPSPILLEQVPLHLEQWPQCQEHELLVLGDCSGVICCEH